jgi:hypothetical protein
LKILSASPRRLWAGDGLRIPKPLLRERKPQAYRFTDDGIIPNHPRWPLIIYKTAVRLPECLDPAAVFEELFDSRG